MSMHLQAPAKEKEKEKDPDPHGDKLAQVEDPLAEAMKLLQRLREYSGDRLRTHELAFEVNSSPSVSSHCRNRHDTQRMSVCHVCDCQNRSRAAIHKSSHDGMPLNLGGSPHFVRIP